jgi:hypothetical protein
VQAFKKAFTRFVAKAGISDVALCQAVRDADRGLISADLGGGVIKQRIARPGQGKSGGFRTLIVFRAGTRAIFVHGFAKNEKDNIEEDELVALKKLAGGVAGVRRQDARASCYVWGAAGGEVR